MQEHAETQIHKSLLQIKQRPSATRSRDNQSAHKEIRGCSEEQPRVPDAAKIHDRDNCEDYKTQQKSPRLEPGYCRNESAHSGGYAHGYDENVVNHQRRGGEKSCGSAEVLACDGIRPSTAGISLDRLAIGEIHNRQENL
jgi:hypothetical protein